MLNKITIVIILELLCSPCCHSRKINPATTCGAKVGVLWCIWVQGHMAKWLFDWCVTLCFINKQLTGCRWWSDKILSICGRRWMEWERRLVWLACTVFRCPNVEVKLVSGEVTQKSQCWRSIWWLINLGRVYRSGLRSRARELTK